MSESATCYRNERNFFVKSRAKIALCIIMGISFSLHSVTGQKATIREEIKTIKTYPYNDPNPIPTLALNNSVSCFYPYFMFDGYTSKSTNMDWKVVTLENDFIKVSILPGVGGKVWGAIEKSTGKDFIYLNQVVKFRSIGIRGPWTSGGIEHNFGLDFGHAPWTASVVDYILKENPDGSVSCIVGGLDLASRTQWRVEIRLPKDKAYFETRSMWYNPTPLHDAYLSWENAAYKATEDLEFYFPGNIYIGHGGDVSQWPIDKEGRILSLYKNNNFGSSKSYHVFGNYPNWFGGYYHNSDFGSGHWAPYDEAPGKKIWIWSLARDGAIWEDLLTDNDGQYIEAQSGVKFNQASPSSGYNSPFDQLSMRPFYTEMKSEFWFPVKGTGGMIEASPGGTLNLISLKDSLKISFCPNVIIKDSLSVRSGEKLIFKEFLKLNPLQVYQKTISFPAVDNQVININIGKDLLTYTSDEKEKKITRPVTTPPGQDVNSAEHLFRIAEDERSMRDYSGALKTYLVCLEKEPTHSRALTKVAELYYRKGEFEEGLTYARKVLENNTYDGGANFIYGVIQKAMGNFTQAEEGFSIAVRTMEYRSGAYVEIAGLHLLKKNYRYAIDYAKKALDYNRYNIVAYEFLGTAYRKLNMNDEARKTSETLLEIDPLNNYARFEQYLLDPSTKSLLEFNSGIRNELPHESYLELALEYANNGFNEEAIQILEQSPKHPTAYYWLAYLNRTKSPNKSQQYLKQAVDMSPLMVFPSRLEAIPVLTWASEQNPSWKNIYYLGLVYWNIQRTEKAKELFIQCGNSPDYAYFYIARGILFQNEPSQTTSVSNDFDRAKNLAPKEWRTWHYVNLQKLSTGNFTEELKNSQQAFALFPGNPVLGIDLAKALGNTGQFSEARNILKSINILPSEGAREGYEIYELTNLSLALENLEKKKYKRVIEYLNSSKEYPENLGSGKPYEPDSRQKDFIAAYCETKLGNKKSADNYYQQIIDYSSKRSDRDDPINFYITTMALKAQGKLTESDSAIKKWKAEKGTSGVSRTPGGSSSPAVQWVMAKFNNDEEKAQKLEAEILTGRGSAELRIFLKAIKLMDL